MKKNAKCPIRRKRRRQVLKKDFHIYESYKLNGKRVYRDYRGREVYAPNGIFHSDGRIYVDLNAGITAKGLTLHTLSHELTHFIKEWSPQKYRELAGFLIKEYEQSGADVNAIVLAKQKRLSILRKQAVSYDEAFHEVVADSFVKMFDDGKMYQTIEKLKKVDKGIVEKIKEFFGNIASKIARFQKSAEAESFEGKYISDIDGAIERMREAFAKALVDASSNYNNSTNTQQKNTTREGDVKMQLRESMDGNLFVDVENITIHENSSAKEISNILSKIVEEKFSEFINISGQKIGIKKRTAKEWQNSKNAQYLRKNDSQIYYDKVNSFSNADELLKASREYVGEEIKHIRQDSFVEFARGLVDFKVGDRGYSADIIVGTTKDGKALLYDVVNIAYKKIESASNAGQFRRSDTLSTDSINQNDSSVNTYSMQESKNNSEMHSDRDSFGNINSLLENDTDKLYNDKNGLSEPEVAAILSYKSSESYKINALLRSGKELTIAYKEFVENLDNALSKLPIHRGTVYRNIVFDGIGGEKGYNAFLDEHKPDSPILYKAFTSASTKKDGYLLDGALVVRMVIESVNARDVDGYGSNLESEVIFPRNSTYIVKSVEYNSKGQPIIFITEVVENGKGKYGQFYTKERGETVQPLSTSQSGNNYMQSVSELDTSRGVGRRENLQEISGEEGLKFSDRDYSAISNRSLLADALESSAQNDIEKNKLSEYKAKIEEMDRQSEKLSELRRQIKELSFSKGPRDKAKIRALQDEAIKTANRIDLYDKQLLKLEAAKPL